MGERSQINIRVDEERKDDWDTYVEESGEVNSLTQLIRLAVTRHINGVGRDDGGATSEVSLDTSEMEQTLYRLENKVDTLSDDVGVVKGEVTTATSRPVPETSPDSDEVFAAIPSGSGPEDGATPWEVADNMYGRETDRAESLKVGDVMTKLQHAMSVVKWDEESLRYWKEDD